MSRWITLILAGTALLLVCGCSSPKPRPVETGSGAANSEAGGIPCTSDNRCPGLALTIAAEPSQGASLYGIAGQAGTWTFRSTTVGGVGRDLRLEGRDAPPVGGYTQQGKLATVINYQSPVAVSGAAPIKIILRDVSQCQALHPEQETACADLRQTEIFTDLAAFQKTALFSWTIGNDANAPAPKKNSIFNLQ